MTSPIECNSAEEFVDTLSPIGDTFKKYPPNAPLLFRGHSDDSYRLIPKALRVDRPLSKLTGHDCNSYESQVLAEKESLIEFFLLADKRGLPLPEDSQRFRSLLEYYKNERGEINICKPLGDTRWPNKDLLSLIALAQHYGLPTRLLDWTKNVYVAAYFAAEKASSPERKKDGKLAVWCFHYPAMGAIDPLNWWSEPIVIVTAPSASNLNLKAQQGVFTMVNFPITESQHADRLPLDKVLERAAQRSHGNAKSAELFCLTLPQREAPRLLWLLAKMDITASTVYPGYSGVVMELEQRSFWQSH